MTVLDLRPSDAPAIIDGGTGEVTTFRDLHDRADSLDRALGGARTLVFTLARNDLLTAGTYAAALLRGHAIALLDGIRPLEANLETIAAYGPHWVVGPAGTADRLSEAGAAVRASVPWLGGEVVRLRDARTHELHPDLTLLLSTSGTTGSRRFVRLSAANLHANASAIASYLGLSATERPITSLPLHYTFGLSVLNSHWLVGAPVVLSGESVVMRTFWEQFRAHGCTSFAGVPFTFAMLERIGFREMQLPTLSTIQQAGGALDRHLTQVYEEHMERRGGRFFVMYGQTEATARIAFVPPDRLGEKLGSAGIAIPGGRLWIDGAEPGVPTGVRVGEVVYEGPNVMLGYASGPDDLSRGDEQGGVLRTGDIGYLDADGFLFLVGRSKRIAKVYGLRVNLDEVEAIVREHGPAAVVGGDDTVWAFCAFGTEGTVSALGDALAKRFRINRQALCMRHVEEIPMSGVGKVDYQKVQAWVPS